MARIVQQTLPQPPAVYDQEYIAQLASAVNRYMIQRESQGELITARVIMTDPPELGTGTNQYPDTKLLPTGTIYLTPAAVFQPTSNAPADPASTSSTTWVMMGLGMQFTAAADGSAVFTLTGQIGNTTNNGETDVQLRYGTGTPPAFGVPATGTPIGQPMKYVAPSAGSTVPFSRTVTISGLVAGTTYWIGVAVQCPHGASILSNLELTGYGFPKTTAEVLTVVKESDP